MPEHDETVRLATGTQSGRPSPTGRRPAVDQPAVTPAAATRSAVDTEPVDTEPVDTEPVDTEPDDTRPVGRDWMRGAPEAEPVVTAGHPSPPEHVTAAGHGGPPPPTSDDWATQKLDLPQAGDTLLADAPPDDATQHLVPVPEAGPGGPGTPGGPPVDDDGPAGPGRPWWRRSLVLAPAAAIAVLGAAYGVDLLVSSGDIPRSTVVAGVEIGGLSPAAAAEKLEKDLGPRVVADHTVVADDVKATLSPATAGITLDVPGTVDAADDQPLNPWTRLVMLFADRTIDPVITGEPTALDAQIEGIATQVDRAPTDASIAIQGTTPSLVQPVDGRTLDRKGAAAAITEALASGGDPATPIELPVDVAKVHVDTAEAQRVLDETVMPALSGPVTVVSSDGGTSAEVPVAAIAASLTFTPKDDGTLAVSIDPAKLQRALGEALHVFGTPAKDATFDISGGTVTVVPSVDGTGVDPAHLAEQLLPVLVKAGDRKVTAELGPVPADFTTEAAQKLGIKEEISSFTTHFTSTASGTNIRVVAEEVDGALIKPGETFSLNGFTGPRGTAEGYVPAGVINNGEFTTAVGGGISQFATTMFNAVFFAGLEDVYHKPHSYYISRYPAGREATVYYDSIDLKWRNDSNTGVYVDTQWVPGSITVTFYGTKHYEIQSLSGDRYNVRQPVVQDKPDDGNCKAQAGAQGFDITVTRVFRDVNSGAEIKRENFRTHYAAEPIIHCLPPAPPAPGAPSPTPTPGG
jgi:vancomycin resistance protein YoaR